jgi:hypothetical protein
MSKGKRGSRGKSRGRKISERLEWRISYAISKRLLKNNTPEAIRKRALEYYEENGEEMPGVKMRAQWRNPKNKNPKHAAWKYTSDPGHSLDAFFETIKPALAKALKSHHKPKRLK